MEFEWNSKDKVNFELYNDVVESKKTQIFIWLESDNREVDLNDFRSENGNYRFNNFNINEDKDKNLITFCPNIAGCPAYFRIVAGAPFHISVIRKDGTIGENTAYGPGEVKIDLNPVSMRQYKVNIVGGMVRDQQTESADTFQNAGNSASENVPEFFGGSFSSSAGVSSGNADPETIERSNEPSEPTNFFANMFSSTTDDEPSKAETSNEPEEMPASGNVSGFSVPYVETEGIRERREKVQDLQTNNDIAAKEVENLDRQIAELEDKSRQLADNKASLISHMEALQREYDKDYSKYQVDLDEIKGRYAVDQTILEYYKDKDLVPIENLIDQTNNLVDQVEEQIRLFVAAQQKKSDDIEKALKVGKKE